METSFKKSTAGAVINTNKKGLREAKRLKKQAQAKKAKEQKLVDRMDEIDNKLDYIIQAINDLTETIDNK